jgi:tripartite-type tricarboxylate transporter receptor subunit TctC
MEVFQAMTGTRLNHVPYSGAGPAMNDVVGGHVNLMFAALSIVKGSVQAGKLRMIGFAFASATTSFTDVTGNQGLATKAWVAETSAAIGAKSRNVSYGIFS